MKTNYTQEDFSISEGGPIYDWLTKLPFLNTQKRLAILGICIAWIPLVIISAFEGTLFSGVQVPFIYDIAMQARILIALPMLIIIRVAIDEKVMEVAKYLSMALMGPDERQLIISTAFRRSKKLTSSALTEIILLLIIVAFTTSLVRAGVYSALESGTTSWMATIKEGRQTLSLAGYYSVFVSIPFFQFFLLRWLWRYFVWTLLLFRLSKANLKLLPTHPDRCGGLGLIILAQRSFCMFFVANAIVISGQFIQQLLKHPDTFLSIRNMAYGFIVICLVLLIFPLIFFAGKLFKTKNEGLLNLSLLGADLSRKFEQEWLDDFTIEKTTEEQSVDPSMIYDYGGIYESLEKLKVIPVTIRDIAGMGIMLFAPFIPIAFIHFSVAELIQRIAVMLV